MQWITRERPKIDRIACPWLIARFIDEDPDFLYVPSDEVMDVAAETGATPFDVPGVELGHHGDQCSFDAFLARYRLHDAALHKLALIVRTALDRPKLRKPTKMTRGAKRRRVAAKRHRAEIKRNRRGEHD